MERLGAPDHTVQLEPGEVLYVPRGAIHATDTAGAEEGEGAGMSAHLTVGVDSWSVAGDFTTGKPIPALTLTALAERALGSDATGARVRQRALEQLQGEVAFRRSLPLGSGESAHGEAKERLRAALHATVDAMLDDFLAEVHSQHGEVLASWQRAMAQHAALEQ